MNQITFLTDHVNEKFIIKVNDVMVVNSDFGDLGYSGRDDLKSAIAKIARELKIEVVEKYNV